MLDLEFGFNNYLKTEQVKSRPDDAVAGKLWTIAVFEKFKENIAERLKSTVSVFGNKERY